MTTIPATITSAAISVEHGKSVVTAQMSDGSTRRVLHYFADELSFTPDEFVGLTEAEVAALHFKKDREYLRS